MTKFKNFFVVIILFLFCSGCSTQSNDSTLSSFKIYFFEVGHGDSALIICDGHNMMIDCGSRSNTGSNAIINYLDQEGVETLDYVICTHPDKDHYSMFKYVLEGRKVKKVYCSATSDIVGNKDFYEFENSFKTLFKKIEVPKAGESFYLGSAKIEILAVNTKPYSENSNDSSIVLIITYGSNTFLFTGDISRYTEKSLLDKGVAKKAM